MAIPETRKKKNAGANATALFGGRWKEGVVGEGIEFAPIMWNIEEKKKSRSTASTSVVESGEGIVKRTSGEMKERSRKKKKYS